MKKITYCLFAIALLWCCSLAVADGPTISGKPNQGVFIEKTVDIPEAAATRAVAADPEIARSQPNIDPARTSTNFGGTNPEITRIEQNTERTPTAWSPAFKDLKAAKLQGEMVGKPLEGVVILPDPNIILQGGDNIAGATVISAIPYSDSGTTAGYTNDYLGSCGYDAGAPDVVYSYAPVSAEMVTFSLCGSGFDTRLYVFLNDANTEIACNDDFCGPQSQVTVNLNPGSTYYFVVDGYYMDAGAYTVNMTSAPPCLPDFTVNGPGVWNGTTCGAGNDSPLTGAEDHVYAVNLSIAGNWIFSLCGSSETWDTYMFVGSTSCSGDIGSNDDFCGPMSQVTVNIPAPGTYYVTIEGFGPTDCGAYQFSVLEPLPPPVNDSCSAAIPVTTYPSTVCGTVGGATIDCPGILDWPAVWYTFNAPYPSNNISVNYCGTAGMINEVGISVFQNCDDCVFIPANDYAWNMCGNGFLNPAMNWYNLPGPAVYYFAAHTIGVQDFCFDVNVTESVPCLVTCPVGGILENEPDCADDYVDNYNGGCNSDPFVFQPYTFGDTICGKSGTYMAQGMQYRDTDWYSVNIASIGQITWNVVAEFPAQAFIYADPYNDCYGRVELAAASSWLDCDTLTLSAFAASPGTYYFWVGPQTFSGVACGEQYLAWGTIGPPPPCTPDYVITVPGTTAGTTCGMGNDWSYTCLGDYDNGEDILYQFTLAAPMTVDIILDPLGTMFTGFALATDCYMQNCVTQHTAGMGNPHGVTVLPLAAGTYYLMIDTWPMPDCIPAFNLIINESAPPPPNDNCANVTPVPLLDGVPLQFTGNNAGATIDCMMLDFPEVWHAITISECMNVTVDFCGTTPAFANAYLVMTDQCPCAAQIPSTDNNFYTCVDGNITINYYNIQPGTYYIPVLTEVGSMGPYTMNVSGVACPPPPVPDFTVTAPGTWTGNTCGAGNDCYLRPADEHIYQVTIPTSGTWKFSLCNSANFWDSYLILGSTSCSGDIAFDDDFCPPFSEIMVDLPAGAYFLMVEGFNTGCGEYTLDIVEYIPPPNPCEGSVWTNHNQPIAAAMATQCDPVYPFQAGCADDFILSADTSISQVIAWMGFWNGPLDPLNITGINVVFYANNNGVPGGRPLGADPACGYQEDIPGGLISVQQVTTYTATAEPSGLYQFVIDITPVSLTAGTTYWIEVSPVMSSAIGGQIGWAPSDMLTGNSGVQVFVAAEVPNWGPPQGIPTDFSFCLHSTGGGGCAYIPGDINGNGVTNGIDVGYGVNYFKGSMPPPIRCGMCPQPAPFYAGGDVNGSCVFNGIDITFFVNYLKGIVPSLLYCPTCPPLGFAPSMSHETKPILQPEQQTKDRTNTAD